MTDTNLWHPFADMAAVRGNELVLDRAISPPLIVTSDQIREIADVVHTALEALAPVGAAA
jgi:hypothetical protein